MEHYFLFTNAPHPENYAIPEYLGVEWASSFKEACKQYESRHVLKPGQLLFNGLDEAKEYITRTKNRYNYENKKF